MKTIYKYPLEITDRQEIEMPREARILAVQVQNNVPCLWAVVDTELPLKERIFDTFGTGNPVDNYINYTHNYIGTYQVRGGSLVFHVFERVSNWK